MTEKNSIIEVIKKRKSVRTFDKRPIETAILESLDAYLGVEENLSGPFGGKIKLFLFPVNENFTDKGIKIGTYGIIKNPAAFAAGTVENDQKTLVEFGFVFEKLILHLTELSLGTCWLGGTFDRNSFKKEIPLGDNEIIPCVTPIGYSSEKRRLLESTMRFAVKSDNRKPWSELFYYAGFTAPLTEKDAGRFSTPLEMVRLAPSASNKQPWRIVLAENRNTLHFYLDHTPKYSDTMQRIDVGIAMCHFELSCREAGIGGRWSIKDPGISVPDANMEYIASWDAV